MNEKTRKILLILICCLLAADCGVAAYLLHKSAVLIFLLIPVAMVIPVLRPTKPAEEEVPEAPEEELAPAKTPCLVVGLGLEALRLQNEMARDPECPYETVGFVDDTGLRSRNTINGIPVAGELSELPALPGKTGAEALLVCARCDGPETRAQLDTLCKAAGVPVLILPEEKDAAPLWRQLIAR